MYKELKNILRHGSIYMVGIILGRIVGFLMIPVYTSYLTPADYGTLSLLGLTIDIVATIFGLGMASAVVRTYQKFEEEPTKRQVISSALLGSITVMALITTTALLLSPQLSQLIFSSDANAGFFRLTFLGMFLASGIEIPMIFLRIKLKSGNYVGISLLKLTLQLSLNLWFLVGLGLGINGILYSTVISGTVFATYLTISTLRQVGFAFDLSKYVEMLRFGMPIIVSDISSFMLTYSDRYFLNYFTDLTTVGIYSMAYTFGMILSMIVNGPFMSIWGTEMFKYGKQEDGKPIFAKVLIYYLLVSLTVCLGLSLLTRDVLRIVANQSFWSAYKYVPLICLSYVLNGALYIAGSGILLAGRTKYRAYSTATAMIANLALNFLLIPTFGAWGAAIATFASYIVRLVLDVFFAQRLYHVTYDIRRVSILGVLFLLILLPAALIHIDNLLASLAVNTLAVLLFPVLVFFSGVLTTEEKAWVLRFFKTPVSAIKDFRTGSG
jgi:O-antigen/teichoic acid export membrane protein